MVKEVFNPGDPAVSVMRTLIYYDVFNYPLTEEEILGNSVLLPGEITKLRRVLAGLLDQGIVFRINGYYSLSNDPEQVKLRLKGNSKAEKWMKKARWFSGLISGFPYVRGVSVSGSLSKGWLGEEPDIDYFIITEPNRLWLARTLLVAFKKLFLLNSYKYFCINYFIDTENLEIEEKNLFTATEIATMIPMFGNGVKQEFFDCNSWVREYYPNYPNQEMYRVNESKSGMLKRFFEAIFNNSLGDWLDSRFMKLTVGHWEKKFRNRFPEEEFRLIFKSSKRISKHHPQNFQKKVSVEFNKRKEGLEKTKNLDLKNVVFQV